MAEEFEDGMSVYSGIGSMFSSNQALSSTFGRKKKKKRKKKGGGTGSEVADSDTFDMVEDSGMSPLLTGAVQLLDEAVVESGSKRVLETYDMIKSMMEMWNPQASRWAANASATYK